MLAEVEKRGIDELRGRFREDDLATMTGSSDARGEVHLFAHVPLFAHARLAGVQPDPHLDTARGVGARHLRRGRERARSGGEGEEEGVALGVDLDSSAPGACRTHDPAVVGERLVVGLVADLVQELRGALDIGEEERDDARRKLAPHVPVIMRRSPHRVQFRRLWCEERLCEHCQVRPVKFEPSVSPAR
jgi:hypothetical protein